MAKPALALLATTAAAATAADAQFTAYGLTTTAQGTQQLVRLKTASPNSVATVGPTGVTLTGIDFRPATNQLYGYDGDKLYIVNLGTGAATLIGAIGAIGGIQGLSLAPVPEPGTWALMLTGLFGLGLTARRRRNS